MTGQTTAAGARTRGPYYIQVQHAPRARYKIETSVTPYFTADEAQAVIDQRKSDGWEIPMRVCDCHRRPVCTALAKTGGAQ